MKGLINAVTAYPQAVQVANKHGLWSFMWIPGLVSLLIGGTLFWTIWTFTPVLGDWMISWYTFDFGVSIMKFTARVTAAIAMITLSLFIYKYIVLIVSFPFMSFVSQKVEIKLYGNIDTYQQPSQVVQFVREMIRGIKISLVILSKELFWIVIILVLSFIPGLGLLTVPAMLIVQSYYAGCCNMDYTLERYFDVKNAMLFMRENFWSALGNGFVFLMLLGIPLIGLFLAPIVGTIAATIESLKVIRGESDNL